MRQFDGRLGFYLSPPLVSIRLNFMIHASTGSAQILIARFQGVSPRSPARSGDSVGVTHDPL